MDYDGQLVDIGAYQACMQCEKLPTKPLVQLQRMAEQVPDESLQGYRTDRETEALVDRIERLAERHQAGWHVSFGDLEHWEADLLVYWLSSLKQMERQQQQFLLQMQLAVLKGLRK